MKLKNLIILKLMRRVVFIRFAYCGYLWPRQESPPERAVRYGRGIIESGASEALILSTSEWRQPGGHCPTRPISFSEIFFLLLI